MRTFPWLDGCAWLLNEVIDQRLSLPNVQTIKDRSGGLITRQGGEQLNFRAKL